MLQSLPYAQACGCLLLLLVAPATHATPWQRSAPSKTAGSATELRIAHAHLLAATGRPSAALTRLRALDAADGPLAARLYAGFGMRSEASKALSGHFFDPAADRAWLALAQAALAVGDAQAAVSALSSMAVQLDLGLGMQRARLLARALLYLDRPAEAALALRAEHKRQDLPAMARYHLGIALILAGHNSRGIGLLDALGAYAGPTFARKALADQANLALGYWFLDHNRGGYAQRYFLRVRLHTPVTRKAMLGLGWAQISAGGMTQALLITFVKPCQPADPDLWAEASLLHRVPRALCRERELGEDKRLVDAAALQTSTKSQYARAALAWQAAAAGGSARNPVVAEALACRPFMLQFAGDGAAAQAAFQAAIQRLQHTRQMLAAPQDATAMAPPRSELAYLQAGLAAARHYLRGRARTLRQALAPAAQGAGARLAATLGGIAPRATHFGTETNLRGRLVVALDATNSSAHGARIPAQRFADLAKKINALRARMDATTAHAARIAARARQRQRSQLNQRLEQYLVQLHRGLAALRPTTQ